jgi:hypothetical protein
MSQLSSSSAFQALFNTALQDYKHKTGSSLVDRPFAKQFQVFDSVESITTILEEQARIFREFRSHGKLVISLKCLVDVLCSPFFTTVLEKGIDLVLRPKKHSLVCLVDDRYSTFNSHSHLQKQYLPASASYSPYAYVSHPLIAFAYLCDIRVPQTAKDISTSYDALVDLFASFENFLSRLGIYTEIPPTTLTNVLVKIIVVRWIAWLGSHWHKTTPALAHLLKLPSFLASHHTLPSACLLLYPCETLPHSPV